MGAAATPAKRLGPRVASDCRPTASATPGAAACSPGAFPLAIAALNKLGIGPLRADLSGVELRRAGLRAMGEVVARLGIDARHVIFGHTHRSGPLPDDDAGEWRLAGRRRSCTNTGCWVYESMYLDRRLGQPVLAGRRRSSSTSGGEPRLRAAARRASMPAALRPPAAPAPA